MRAPPRASGHVHAASGSVLTDEPCPHPPKHTVHRLFILGWALGPGQYLCAPVPRITPTHGGRTRTAPPRIRSTNHAQPRCPDPSNTATDASFHESHPPWPRPCATSPRARSTKHIPPLRPVPNPITPPSCSRARPAPSPARASRPRILPAHPCPAPPPPCREPSREARPLPRPPLRKYERESREARGADNLILPRSAC